MEWVLELRGRTKTGYRLPAQGSRSTTGKGRSTTGKGRSTFACGYGDAFRDRELVFGVSRLPAKGHSSAFACCYRLTWQPCS